MLQSSMFFVGLLMLLAGLVCRDALSNGYVEGAEGGGSEGGARHVIVFALGLCFVSFIALFGMSR